MRTLLNRKQRGIGLLELMLSLAIIALLLIMATRYYSQAKGSEQVNAASNIFHTVYTAAVSAIANDPSAANSGDTSKLTIANLVSMNLLPSDYGSDGSAVNPWHGAVQITYVSKNKIQVSLSGAPKAACKSLISTLSQDATTSPTSPSGCPNDYILSAEFDY